MARGRMLNKSVSASMRFVLLPDDTCRLLATWTIAHLDKNGVFYGDPIMVKSSIFPRRADVTIEQVEHYLSEMQKVGLIILFEARGQIWQYWPGFADNQTGLRADRENTDYPYPQAEQPELPFDDDELPEDSQSPTEPSPETGKTLSEHLPDDNRKLAGNLPERFPPKGSKKKRNKYPKGSEKSASSQEDSRASPSQEMFGELARVCSINWKIATGEQKGELNQNEKLLRVGASATPQDLVEFRTWWDQYDWRGRVQKDGSPGKPPTPTQVREEWQRFIDWRNKKQKVMATNGNGHSSRNDDGSFNV